MKKAIQIAYNELFEKKCEYASLAGFRYISVNFTEVLDKTEYEWEKIIETIQNILLKNDLSCIQSHPYYYDLLVSSEICEEKYEFAIKQAIVASGKLGAPWCALHPRTSITSGFLTSKSLEDNKKAFSQYLDCAIKYNTCIAIENLPSFPGMWPAMPFYSSDYYDLCELVDVFDDNHVGICWDTGHAHLMHYDQAEAIKFLNKRIKCTHIHNNYRKDDLHYPPDNGNIEWDRVMNSFASIGYDGALTLETHCPYQIEELLMNFARHNFGCLIYLEKLAEEKQ